MFERLARELLISRPYKSMTSPLCGSQPKILYEPAEIESKPQDCNFFSAPIDHQ